MGGIELLDPRYLWAIPAALGAIVILRLLRRRLYAAFPLVSLLQPHQFRASRLRSAPVWIAAAAVPCLAIALSEPVLPYAESEVASRGLDIVLVLDLSSSMEEAMGAGGGHASGLTGLTRMEVTRNALLEFVALRPEDRIGLVVFSDNAYVVSPLTFDHEYLRTYIRMADSRVLRMEGMTAIGEGIAAATALIQRQSSPDTSENKVIIVFTDGEHNTGLDPVEALRQANAAGVRVHTVAVDLPEEVKVRTEVRRLTAAVRHYGGRYFDADTVSQLRAASRAIDALEKGWLVQTRHVRNVPAYHYFAATAIVLITCAMLLSAIPFFIDRT